MKRPPNDNNQFCGLDAPAPPRSREAVETGFIASIWHRCFHRFISAVYFKRITLLNPERLPKTGPTLYLALHRNGAVDGFVYDHVLREPVFMISTQLRKHWFARLFFAGIAVTRTKDEGDRGLNDVALRQCLDQLRGGGELVVFPEGTSSLGPRHLPFKSGAVWLLLDYLDGGGPPLQVVPLGIHYECPWSFQGKVEIVAGAPISIELPPDSSRIDQLRTMKGRVRAALEEVGINVPTGEYQELIQRFAYVATLGTTRSYFKTLKALERGVPEKTMELWSGLEPEFRQAKLWFHQGAPLFATGPVVLYVIALLAISPIVLAAIFLNLPPFAAGWYAGRKFSDDRNVISLWKILVGAPIFALWIGAIILVMLLAGKFLWLAAYVAVTFAGVKLYHRFKQLSVAAHNTLRQPALRKRALAFYENLLHLLTHETA